MRFAERATVGRPVVAIGFVLERGIVDRGRRQRAGGTTAMTQSPIGRMADICILLALFRSGVSLSAPA
jgi:hypothetical protein